jgi:hypothetical protein
MRKKRIRSRKSASPRKVHFTNLMETVSPKKSRRVIG